MMTPKNGTFVNSPLSGAPNSQQKGARISTSVQPGNQFDLDVTSADSPVGPSTTGAHGISASLEPLVPRRPGPINGFVRVSDLPPGLAAVNDHGKHVSIFPTDNMKFGEFQALLNQIPWQTGGGQR